MLTIRFHRVGKTNQPSFKIVVVDKRTSAASGSFCDQIGTINRVTKQVRLDKEKTAYWIGKGAQPSPAVNNLLIAQNIIKGKKIAVHAQPKKKEEPAKAAAPAAPEAPKTAA